jgi:hypothetical protein
MVFTLGYFFYVDRMFRGKVELEDALLQWHPPRERPRN